MLFIGYSILLFCIGFIGYTMYRLSTTTETSLKRRLERFKNTSTLKTDTPKKENKDILANYLETLAEKFEKLDIEITLKEIKLLHAISSISLFLLIFLLTRSFVIASILGLSGLAVPSIIVSRMVNGKTVAFERLFGDALYLIANILKSGFSLRQALQVVATEMPAPVNNEFNLLLQEINWGLSIEEAFANLAQRMPNEHVRLFVTAVSIQTEVGGSLSEIVQKIAETIRTKEEMRGELNALTAQGKVSGIIVGIMPFAVGGLLLVINPAYMLPLFTNPLGIIMVIVAIFMELLAFLSIRAIIKVE